MQPRPLPDRIEYVAPSAIKPSPTNARVHSAEQVRQLIRSMKKFGAIIPLVIDDNGNLIAGHGRLAAPTKNGKPRQLSIPVAWQNSNETDRLAPLG